MEEILLQVGVKALLKNPDGKYLLLRRNTEQYKDVHGAWDIPGGRIHPGSPLVENLQREILEETGLELTDTPVLIAAQDILRVPGKHVVRLTFTAAIAGTPQISDESVEYIWLTPEELRTHADLDFYVKELLQQGII